MISRRAVLAGSVAFPLFASSAHAADEAMARQLLAAAPAHGEKTLGDPAAPVTMIEYASATCPHCARFHIDIWPDIRKDYVDTGKVFFVFREMPLDNLALGVFMLARCVAEDKYFPTIDLLFRKQEVWTRNNPKEELLKIVSMSGLDTAGADACVQKQDLAKAIVESGRKAREEFGVKGTPTFFINGTKLSAHDDLAAVRTALDAELQRLGKG